MTYNPEVDHRRSIRLPQFDYAHAGIYFVTICTDQRECTMGEVVDGIMARNNWGDIAHRFWAALPTHFPTVALGSFVVMPNHTHANIIILNDQPHPDACRGEVSSPRATPDSPGGETIGGGISGRDTVGAETRGEETSPLRGQWSDPAAVGAGFPRPGSPRPVPHRGEMLDQQTPGGRTLDGKTMDGRTVGTESRGGETPPLHAPGPTIDLVSMPACATAPLQPTLGQIVAYYKYQTTKGINRLRDMPGARFWQRNYWEHVVRSDSEMSRIEQYIQSNPARWSADQLHPAVRCTRS